MQVEVSIVVLSVRDVSGNIHEAGAPTVDTLSPRLSSLGVSVADKLRISTSWLSRCG